MILLIKNCPVEHICCNFMKNVTQVRKFYFWAILCSLWTYWIVPHSGQMSTAYCAAIWSWHKSDVRPLGISCCCIVFVPNSAPIHVEFTTPFLWSGTGSNESNPHRADVVWQPEVPRREVPDREGSRSAWSWTVYFLPEHAVVMFACRWNLCTHFSELEENFEVIQQFR